MTHTVGQSRQGAGPNGHRTSAQQPPGEIRQQRSSGSVPLRRLLGLATLTPPQAAHIAVDVLTSLQPESENYGAFDAQDVLIDGDGAIRLVPRTFTPGTATAAGELVRQLARNADRPAARKRPAQAALLTALDQCAAGLAAGDLAAPLTELRRELEATGIDRERLIDELAALVAVPLIRVGAEPGAQPGTPPEVPSAADAAPTTIVVVEPDAEAPEALTAAPPSFDQPAPPAPTGTRRPPPRLLIAGVIIAVVALVTIVSVIVSSSGGKTTTQRSAPPGRPTHAQSASTSVAAADQPAAVHRPAPPAAGPISRVTLIPASTCTAGAVCTVTVRMWLRPPGLSRLTWHATLVDRCTRRSHAIESGAMIAQPGWRSVYTTVQLRLPHKSSMAVLAVVNTPVSASSRPLLIPADGGSCG